MAGYVEVGLIRIKKDTCVIRSHLHADSLSIKGILFWRHGKAGYVVDAHDLWI